MHPCGWRNSAGTCCENGVVVPGQYYEADHELRSPSGGRCRGSKIPANAETISRGSGEDACLNGTKMPWTFSWHFIFLICWIKKHWCWVHRQPERYSNKAVRKLKAHGHDVVAVAKRSALIDEVPVLDTLPELHDIDTVTLYVRPWSSAEYYNYLMQLHPKTHHFQSRAEKCRVGKNGGRKRNRGAGSVYSFIVDRTIDQRHRYLQSQCRPITLSTWRSVFHTYGRELSQSNFQVIGIAENNVTTNAISEKLKTSAASVTDTCSKNYPAKTHSLWKYYGVSLTEKGKKTRQGPDP